MVERVAAMERRVEHLETMVRLCCKVVGAGRGVGAVVRVYRLIYGIVLATRPRWRVGQAHSRTSKTVS